MNDGWQLADKAFSFIRVAPRPPKPRERGLTIVADRGMGLRRTADLLESAGDHVDVFKIAIGAWRLQDESFLARKLELLAENRVRTFLAGDATEAAILQGVAGRLYHEAARIGFDAVEVSGAQIVLGLEDKCRLVEQARAAGLAVVAEVGRKGAPEWTSGPARVRSEIAALQDAGAWKVLVQGEGLLEGVSEPRHDRLLEIASGFRADDLIFQAKDGASQEWFLASFGSGVNLDVDDHHVLDLELMRRGLRKRGLFQLVGGGDGG